MSVPRVAVLCTGNSCRSQMGEAILRARFGDRIDAVSAGTEPAARVHPLALLALGEIGVPAGALVPKTVAALGAVDLAITVCGDAADACPVLPGEMRRVHCGFDDPARAEGTDEEKLRVFRRVRDEIRERLPAIVEAFLAERD